MALNGHDLSVARGGRAELLVRQEAQQAEAAQVVGELGLDRRFGDVSPVLVVGSYLSGSCPDAT
jgi:hypothetical protein